MRGPMRISSLWCPCLAQSAPWFLGATLVVAAPALTQAQLWRTIVGPESGIARVVTHLAGGDAVVAGKTAFGVGTVVRLSSSTGTEVWRRELNGTFTSGDDALGAVATNAAGTDVYVGGRLRNSTTSWDFTVARLSGTDGSVVWQREIDGAATDPDDLIRYDEATSIAVDAAGDVIAGGNMFDTGIYTAFTIFKLSGADGSTVWKTQLDPSVLGGVREIVLDTNGDVIAAGGTNGGGVTLVLAKLDGATGAELWRYELPDRAPG